MLVAGRSAAAGGRGTLGGTGVPADDMLVTACFRWHGLKGEEQWCPTPPPRVIETKSGAITIGVLVPQELALDKPNWLDWGKDKQHVAYTGFGLVPLADFHLVVSSPTAKWSPVDLVQQVGITSLWMSLALAVLAGLVAWCLRCTRGVAGMASPLAAAKSAARAPRWSDLVVTGDRLREVDVTRVQMLLFTLIAAIFVSIKRLNENQIPDIPAGILTLIGTSNGVYLTAKFVRGPA